MSKPVLLGDGLDISDYDAVDGIKCHMEQEPQTNEPGPGNGEQERVNQDR